LGRGEKKEEKKTLRPFFSEIKRGEREREKGKKEGNPSDPFQVSP